MTPIPTRICHMTHVTNIKSMMETRGILSHNLLLDRGFSHQNIAFTGIQQRRSSKRVPCGRGGVIHDYVPFYFNPRSPMLFTIHKGNVDTYNQGQWPLVHLVTNAQAVEASGRPFVFCDGHAVMAFTDFFTHLSDLEHIDWELMRARIWRDSDEDSDRVRRRQAEFLVYEYIPFELITEIGVYNQEVKNEVETALHGSPYRPDVTIRRNWYY